MTPDTRPMIEWIRDNREAGLTGAEIGVNHGLNAEYIRNTLKVVVLYLVDAVDYGINGLMVGYSNDIVKKFQDGWLDFVYIDANHQYEYVLEDIKLWTPKVKKGGVIGGHDYHSSAGVKQAVNEVYKDFYQEKEDWWVIKNG